MLMVKGSPQFKPRKISDAQFRRSNVFVAWSRKVERRVHVIGPSQYDAWLLVEFDPGVGWFCERPPVDIELLPVEGKRRPLDFWLRRRSGKQSGVVLHDAALARDKACPLDLLERSIARSELKCEVWQATDIRNRTTYLRNLKQLQPFVGIDQPSDEHLAKGLLAHLDRVRTATWEELATLFASRFEGVVNSEIARLIHAGRVKANLAEHALASNTMLSVP